MSTERKIIDVTAFFSRLTEVDLRADHLPLASMTPPGKVPFESERKKTVRRPSPAKGKRAVRTHRTVSARAASGARKRAAGK